jgi:putative CocE/NonD family hydrolase
LRSFHYGFDERDPELAFLEFEDAVNGAARRGGDGVLEERGVIAGFEDHAGRALHGLGGEQRRNVTRQTDFHSSLGEGFENDVGEGRTAGGKPGDGIHVLLVDDHGAANGAEHGLGDFEVLGGSVGAAADAGHATAHGGTGVWHGANNRNLFSDALLDIRSGNGRSDGNHQRIFAERGLDFFQDAPNHLGLYGKQDDVGVFDGPAVVGGRVDAELDGKSSGLFFVTNGAGDTFRRKEALLEISSQKNAAELAGAENGKIFVLEFRSHSGTILTEETRVVNKRLEARSDRMRGMRGRVSLVLIFSAASVAVGAAWLGASGNGLLGAAASGTRRSDVAVAMRDGVVLLADILLPKAEGRFPTLVYRTPYGKHNALKEWSTFGKAVARGYAVVIQDVRGRYASDGEFAPYQNEGKDGYDTIEWAARQPWSDGNVGTFGLSYPGAVQWLAAVENPPHLKAMVPAMTFSTPRNFFYSGGLFDGSWLEWIWMNIAPDARKRKHLAGPQSRKEAASVWKKEHERLENYLPLRELPDLKEAAPFYYQWLAHPAADSWWDWAELRNKYDRVHCAVLNFSGWYDEAYGPDGATTNFNGLLATRKGEANPRTRTIIGPWTHGGEDERKSGERDFGPTAPIDYDELILRWMDHYLRGQDNGVGREQAVRIFVMGKNEWRDEDEWPPKRARAESFYLGAKDEKARIGGLSRGVAPGGATKSSLLSDPAHPVTDIYDEYGAHDYRGLAGREDVLVFDSEPLNEDLEVTGPIKAEMYISADVPDFDLWVRLLDVAPDGTAFNLMSPGLDVLRVSYRDESVEPELLEPGRVCRLDLERMVTSNVFLKGHRIRVQISGAFYPHFSRNLQTGKSEIVSAESRVGRLTIHHDREHASRIVLPVVDR